MSLRQLVEGDCGNANPLMQFVSQVTRDASRQMDVLPQHSPMVADYREHLAPIESFKMETLLQEMRDIEQAKAPPIQTAIDISSAAVKESPAMDDIAYVQSVAWTEQFKPSQEMKSALAPMTDMINMQPQQQQIFHATEFFDGLPDSRLQVAMQAPISRTPYCNRSAFIPPQQVHDQFFDEAEYARPPDASTSNFETIEDWLGDFEKGIAEKEQNTPIYDQFWQRLQDEWQKLSTEYDAPWLSDLDQNFDPYGEYQFSEDNCMADVQNPLAKGKEYLANGDIPSAVLCFEAATSKDPRDAEAWTLLGISQAENERDPQAIAALRRSLDIDADNGRALMALAICYTNESLHGSALKMLIRWLEINPKYRHIVEKYPQVRNETAPMFTSVIEDSKLKQTQQMFLEAVRQNPKEIDCGVQEALGVLYNLSSEFDKAVDCFHTALSVDAQNARLWNRLGASLANGMRSVEAIEVYKRALTLEPGFIRARYNVGVCCMNLKAYKQAVEHFLVVLNMQANSAALQQSHTTTTNTADRVKSQSQMSEAIWSTLKMAVNLMDRADLQESINQRDLFALNKEFLQ